MTWGATLTSQIFSPNAQQESTAHAKPLQPLRLDLGVDGARDSHLNVMIRALIDHRLRRVCAIQAGMAAIAVTVGVVTIMIHHRIR
jgi:hypothetical protein